MEQRIKRPISYYLGNILMLLGVAGILFIYIPVISLYFLPRSIEQNLVSSEFSISIPKIQATGPVIKKVDPWNEKEYLEALHHGVAHAKGTSLPGENGTIFLFAHSADYPWNITRYNTAFFRLHELKKGDSIHITLQSKVYRYVVTDSKTVWPNETGFLKNLNQDQLILQTCTPIGTSLKRLLIFAQPQ